MRRTRKQATSPFSGVCTKGDLWLAQFKKGRFYRRYPSEMEAFAHFIRVYVEYHGKSLESSNMLLENPVWKGRLEIERMTHYSRDVEGKLFFRFPIDRDENHVVHLNEEDYNDYRNDYWFLRDGRITGVAGCYKVNGRYQFDYQYLDALIFQKMSGQRPGVIVRPLKRDGNELNLRRSNLTAPPTHHPFYEVDLDGNLLNIPSLMRKALGCDDESFQVGHGLAGDIRQVELESRFSDPSKDFEDEGYPTAEEVSDAQAALQRKADWEEESWLASFSPNEREASDQPSWGNEVEYGRA